MEIIIEAKYRIYVFGYNKKQMERHHDVCFFLLSGVYFEQMIKDTKIRKTDKSR